MRTRKYLTMALVLFLAGGIVLLFAGGPSLAGAQQTQKATEKGGVSAPETPNPGTQIQKPAALAPQPPVPPASDEPAPDDKYEEYECQC
jgi:hypothetical protein